MLRRSLVQINLTINLKQKISAITVALRHYRNVLLVVAVGVLSGGVFKMLSLFFFFLSMPGLKLKSESENCIDPIENSFSAMAAHNI